MYFSKMEGRAKGNQRLIHFIAEREEQKLGKYRLGHILQNINHKTHALQEPRN